MKILPLEKITKSMFDSYRHVQMQGHYNMIMDAHAAARAAGLSEIEYWSVIQHYGELQNKFYSKEK